MVHSINAIAAIITVMPQAGDRDCDYGHRGASAGVIATGNGDTVTCVCMLAPRLCHCVHACGRGTVSREEVSVISVRTCNKTTYRLASSDLR